MAECTSSRVATLFRPARRAAFARNLQPALIALAQLTVACGGADSLSLAATDVGASGSAGSSNEEQNPQEQPTSPAPPGLDDENDPAADAGAGSSTPDPVKPIPKFDVPVGEPFSAPPLTWTAIPVAGSVCRDGSETGIGVNLNPGSKKLIIFFEGGGACFNNFTCTVNPNSWTPNASTLATWTNGHALFDRNGASPFKDWNQIYIPYCSGDAHTGASMSGYSGQPQMGQANYVKALSRIIATFKNLDEVTLSGMSAGGFGAAWNWLLTQDAFGDVPVADLDDSGPPFGPEYLSPCQQQRFAELWAWNKTIHPACTTCDVKTGNVVRPLVQATLRATKARFALLSHTEDSVIKTFFAFGLDNCAKWDDPLPPSYPQGLFGLGLSNLRGLMAGQTRVAMFVVNGSSHTFVRGDMSNVKTHDITLLDWIGRFVSGDTGWKNVVP